MDIDGHALEPVKATFVIAPPMDKAVNLPVPQPNYATLDTSELDLSREAMDRATVTDASDTTPAMPGAVGPAWRIGPSEAFTLPQRAWLAHPDRRHTRGP